MISAPEWLPEFPFLQAQWPAVGGIVQAFASPDEYDVHQDWTNFVEQFKAHQSGVDSYAMLRQFRKSRLAYLAIKDLSLSVNEHLATMNQVSALADFLIQQAYQLAVAEMVPRYGHVLDHQGQQVHLLVFALGKLGTGELNYSSDVDLVFLYQQEGVSDGSRSLDAASYFVRLGQKIIRYLDHYSADGLVYRVDMRLRPFGSAAPLVCTVAAFQQYLLYEGREWERFAWMRARMVCGHTDAAQAVMSEIRPFIYRKHLDYAVFQSLARIKTEIAGQLSFTDDDLKQGAGGIRAVEFIVQSLQMVFGGRNGQLQGASISQQIHALAAAGKLMPEDAAKLHEAWLWLRKTENICQVVADQDTHQISENTIIRQVIAENFGYASWLGFKQQLDDHRKQVAHMFNELFEETDVVETLEPQQHQLIQSLMTQLPVNRLPQTRREQVEQLLKTAVTMAEEPVLQDFTGLVKKILTRPSYLLMLQKESNVLRKVLQLLRQSPYFVKQLQSNPMLLEQLFEQHEMAMDSPDELKSLWASHPYEADLESWMEAARSFKLAQQFIWAMAWTDQRISRTQFSSQLTILARFILSEVVKFCWQETKSKFPQSTLEPTDFMVIAYGSAAIDDMTVNSDLDLVFLVEADLNQADHQLFTQKWVKRIIHHLTSQMYHGKLYELDMQLRPNGQSGPLVTTRSQFERYQLQEAWVWEHAAMVKSKMLVGTPSQVHWHESLRRQVLSLKRQPDKVDQAMSEMAEKLHHFDAKNTHKDEFQVLAGVLKHSHQYPELLATRTLASLQLMLLEKGLIDRPEHRLEVHKKDPLS